MKFAKVTQYYGALLWVALLLLTVVTRFYDLGNKPIHFDESINGWFVIQMQALGYYKYDPTNYHGPLLFYLIQFFEFLWGASVETLRAVPATFSVFSIMLFFFPLLKKGTVLNTMAVFLLLSPAVLFFGRSGIHESPFVFFQLLFAMGFLRWFEKPDGKAFALVLTGVVGMMVLKETFTVTGFCWLLGLLSLGPATLQEIFAWSKLKSAWSQKLSWLTLILVILFVQLFTGFFKNMMGLADFFKAIVPWLQTGVHGKGHEKEFFYWLKVLWQAEPLALLGVALSVPGMFSKNKSLRVVSVFSLSQLFIYSLIPYKTVWCILSLVWGFYLVLAYSLQSFFTRAALKWVAVSVVAVLAFFNLRSMYLSSYAHPLDFAHPYIYVNSTYELEKLQEYILEEVRKNPELFSQPVQIGMKEQWPWPWVLRSFTKLDYNLCSKSLLPDAMIYFCDPMDSTDVDVVVKEAYWKLQIVFRQAREPSIVYLKKSVFPNLPFENAEVVGGEE
ncbi:TIGR03663 family protein [Bdellovibrio sp. ArHS]|uniref:TIGR03663 family protein n=1 Tax=Bdellovibrio sp. ArHS TaxID=1569284 RepID=UPI0025B9C6C3|nr:TIGR03663 family protein [Bdellovibrio sp. ArHS]